MFLTIVLSLLLQFTQPSFTLQSGHVSNVFISGEQVNFKILGSTRLHASYTVLDFEGHTVLKGEANNEISLGSLPAGYYILKVVQGTTDVSEPISVVYPVLHKRSGPIAVDAADCWLIKPDEYSSASKLLSDAGFGWVRERLLWDTVEPERGIYHWGSYDACINAEAKAGLLIDDIFHSIPPWARADRATNRFPDDLRDAYQFCKTLAVHYKGKIEAWEVWNEADGGFSVDNADAYAAFLKACYLGFKAGNIHLKIAQVAFANPASQYESNLYQNDTQDYFDIYNYHVYTNPMEFSARAMGHIHILDKYGIRNKTIWVTEAGIILPEKEGDLDATEQRDQADFIPKSYAMSLAAGTNKHFFFVFPYYLENGIEFGTLTKNLMPLPGYSALAASTHFLGRAKYLGTLKKGIPSDVTAEGFKEGKNGVLVMWRNSHSAPISLKNGIFGAANFYNCVGSSVPSPTMLGKSPLFVVLPLKILSAVLVHPGPTYAANAHLPLQHPRNPKIVLRLIMPDNTINRYGYDYRLNGSSAAFQLQVYNFSNNPFKGSVRLSIPRTWDVSLNSKKVDIPPMGLKTLSGDVNTGDLTKLSIALLKGYAVENGESAMMSSPICLRLEPDISQLKPDRSFSLNLTNADSWHSNISSNGTMTTTEIAPNTIAFSFHYDKPGDSWAYPYVHFNPSANFSKYNALRFLYKTSSSGSGIQIRVMFSKVNGSIYDTAGNITASTSWKEAIVPFQDLVIGGFSPSDPDGVFHERHISNLMVGINTSKKNVVLEIKGIELLHFKE